MVKFDYQEMRIFPGYYSFVEKGWKLKSQRDNIVSAATNNSLDTC